MNQTRQSDIYSKVVLSKEQINSIDAIYIDNYGEKVPDIWHRYYTSFSGNFDKFYFPDLLYIPEFEYFMNYEQWYTPVLNDKAMIAVLAKGVGIYSPKLLLSCSSGVFRDGEYRLIPKENIHEYLKKVGEGRELFCKPSIDSNSGVGCFVVKFRKGYDEISGKSLDSIIDEISKNYIVQERMLCHSSLANLHEESVNTFRVMTYRWKDEIRVLPVTLRIGRNGACVDNGHAGGIFIAVDNDGRLHSEAYSLSYEKYNAHPDSNIRFATYQIPNVEKIIDTAVRMHMLVPQIGCVNWDLTLDEGANPVLIEANVVGASIWLPQISHGRGIFGSDTPEILRYLRYMRTVEPDKIEQYRFGYNFE